MGVFVSRPQQPPVGLTLNRNRTNPDMGLGFNAEKLREFHVPLLFKQPISYPHAHRMPVDDEKTPAFNPAHTIALLEKDKVIVPWDAMVSLNRLFPVDPQVPCTVVEHEVQVPDKDPKIVKRKCFAPRDHYATFKYLLTRNLDTLPKDCDVTLVVIFDKAELVPPEKHELQRKRAIGDVPQYAFSNIEHVAITDDGLQLERGGEFEMIDAVRIMKTRALRHLWFEYLESQLVKDKELHHIKIIVDFRVGIAPLMTYQGVSVAIDSKPIDVGEGELTAVSWGLHYSRTHHVLLASGDSDLVAIALLHGDSFARSCCVVVNDNWCNVKDALMRLRAAKWSVPSTIMSIVMGGSDYFIKPEVLPFIHTKIVILGIRLFAHILPASASVRIGDGPNTSLPKHVVAEMPIGLSSKKRFGKMLRFIYSLQFMDSKFKTKQCNLIANPSGPSVCDKWSLLTHKDIMQFREQSPNTRIQLPSADVLDQLWHQIWFNMAYWCSLQGTLPGVTNGAIRDGTKKRSFDFMQLEIDGYWERVHRKWSKNGKRIAPLIVYKKPKKTKSKQSK